MLTWTKPHQLAVALDAAYPDVDRLNLDDAALIKLVTALPGFSDPSMPDKTDLQNIIMAWFQNDGDDEAPVHSGEID